MKEKRVKISKQERQLREQIAEDVKIFQSLQKKRLFNTASEDLDHEIQEARHNIMMHVEKFNTLGYGQIGKVNRLWLCVV